jgi:hypothetical protein
MSFLLLARERSYTLIHTLIRARRTNAKCAFGGFPELSICGLGARQTGA